MGTDNFITLFFLIVAALVFLNLRSVLGRRTGHEKPPMNPRTQIDGLPGKPVGEDGNVITLPRRGVQEAENAYAAIDEVAKPDSELNKSLRQIFDADPSFDPKEFTKGARMAYEMIVMAFADGDRKSLKSLLSTEVFEGFNAAISEREKNGEKVKSTFVGIEKADIVSATVSASDASVTMRINSQLISATYDRDGKLIDGDADAVAEVIDIWTFARDIRSRDPNWKLISTQSEG